MEPLRGAVEICIVQDVELKLICQACGLVKGLAQCPHVRDAFGEEMEHGLFRGDAFCFRTATFPALQYQGAGHRTCARKTGQKGHVWGEVLVTFVSRAFVLLYKFRKPCRPWQRQPEPRCNAK